MFTRHNSLIKEHQFNQGASFPKTSNELLCDLDQQLNLNDATFRYDEGKRRMDPGFPRLIQTDWPGIPRRVDAAFKLHGKKNKNIAWSWTLYNVDLSSRIQMEYSWNRSCNLLFSPCLGGRRVGFTALHKLSYGKHHFFTSFITMYQWSRTSLFPAELGSSHFHPIEGMTRTQHMTRNKDSSESLSLLLWSETVSLWLSVDRQHLPPQWDKVLPVRLQAETGVENHIS